MLLNKKGLLFAYLARLDSIGGEVPWLNDHLSSGISVVLLYFLQVGVMVKVSMHSSMDVLGRLEVVVVPRLQMPILLRISHLQLPCILEGVP